MPSTRNVLASMAIASTAVAVAWMPALPQSAASVAPAASTPTLAVIGTIPLNDPREIAITSDDTVFVTSFTDGTTSVIASGSLTIASTITTGNQSKGIAVGSDDSVYVTNAVFLGNVSIIDPVLGSVIRTITGLNTPQGIALTADDTIFVIEGGSADDLARIPAGAAAVDDTVDVGANVFMGIAVTSDDSVYVGSLTDDVIRIFDGTTMTLNATITGVDAPNAAATAGVPGDDTVYFGQGGIAEIIAIPPGTDDTVALPAYDAPTLGLVVDGSRVVAGAGESVVIYDRSPWSVAAAATACTGTRSVDGVGVNSSGVVYATCPLDDKVVVAAEVTASLGATSGDAGDPASLSLAIPDGLIADDSAITSITFGGVAATGWTRSGNTWSGPVPTLPAAGNVPVAVTFNGGLTATAGTFAYGAIPDPTPAPAVPAGAPTDVVAVAGAGSATVSWSAPVSRGSFPVTNYQVSGSPSGSCLVPVASLSCEVSGLRHGESYAFRVRALTGAGWGAWSDPVTVTPSAASIVISGSREGRSVVVSGATTGLVGERVTPWVRFPGPGGYAAGTGVQTVAADGTFTWQRATRKKTYVYFRAEDGTRSNRVIIAAR